MTGDSHPLAPHSLPSLVGAAGGSDPLLSAITFTVILAVLGVGVIHAIIPRVQTLLMPVQMLVFAGR